MIKTYKAAVFLLFLSLFCILGSALMIPTLQAENYWLWSIYSGCFIIFISSLFIVFYRDESSESLKLKYRERKIQEDEAKILQLQKDYLQRANLLTDKENAVKQKLMQYQQYAEFPDDDSVDQSSSFDSKVAELLHDEAEIIFDKLINNRYIERKEFKHELLLADIVHLIESVARVHHPESEHPLLETSIENLLTALNRLSLQLLVLVDSFPINIKEYNLRKTYLYLQKSATTIGYYKKAEPFLTFAAPLLRIGLAANPMVGVAQSVALEAGKQAIKIGSERYALNLLHDVIEIIGGQAETIFADNTARYQNKHWVYAVELTELASHFSPVEPLVLSKVMKIISGLPITNEHDRIYLFHCLAQHKNIKPENFSTEFLTTEDRRALVDSLTHFIDNIINKENVAENNKKSISWRKKAEQRLGINIPLNIDKDDTEYLKNLLNSGSAEKKVKPFLARAILAMMEADETPQFIYADILIESNVPVAKNQQQWLVASNKQLRLLTADENNSVQCIWHHSHEDQPLSFHRIKKVIADDCRVTGGVWLSEFKADTKAAFIIEGKKVSSYDSYFRILINY